MAKRDADGDFDVSPRKTMAMGGGMPSSDFGVASGGSGGVGAMSHPDAGGGAEGRHLGEGERGAGKPIRHSRGKMPAQAHPDHGPHHHKR